jgi:hypothetical protein
VPTGGKHIKEQAKPMISMLKKKMQRHFEGKRFSLEEVCMLLQETS